MEKSYTVYVLEDELASLVKIGIAKDIDQRMRQYKTHNPRAELQFTMTLTGGDYEDAALVERMAFYILADDRRDGEWFATTVAAARDAVRRAANLWGALSAYKCLAGAYGTWYASELAGADGPPVLFGGDGNLKTADEATIGDMRAHVAWLAKTYSAFIEELALRERQLAALPDTPDRRIFDVLDESNVVTLEKRA